MNEAGTGGRRNEEGRLARSGGAATLCVWVVRWKARVESGGLFSNAAGELYKGGRAGSGAGAGRVCCGSAVQYGVRPRQERASACVTLLAGGRLRRAALRTVRYMDVGGWEGSVRVRARVRVGGRAAGDGRNDCFGQKGLYRAANGIVFVARRGGLRTCGAN